MRPFSRRCHACRSRHALRFFARAGWFYELPVVRFFFPDIALCASCERKAIAIESAGRFGRNEWPAPFVGPGRAA
jgi:hypothetical protein